MVFEEKMNLTKKQWVFIIIGLFFVFLSLNADKKNFLGLGMVELASIGAGALSSGTAVGVTTGGAAVAGGAAFGIWPVVIIGIIILLFTLVPGILGAIFVNKVSSSPVLWFALILGFIILLRMLKKR
jgi:hypothetical protein